MNTLTGYSKSTLTDKYILTASGGHRSIHDSEFIVGTQTTDTNSWTGVTTDISLYEGKQITYWLPYSGDGYVTLNLTFSNGSQSGDIPCYYGGITRLDTHYKANNAIRLVYKENVSSGSTVIEKGWWADANYVDGNNKVRYSDKYDNILYPILFGPSDIISGNSYESYYNPEITINPSTNTLNVNISGSAGNIDWENVTNKPNSFTPSQHVHTYLHVLDTRNQEFIPAYYGNGFRTEFKQNGINGLSDGGSSYGLIHFRPYGTSGDFSGGFPHQLAFTENQNIWYRKAKSATEWNFWKKVVFTQDLTQYATQTFVTNKISEAQLAGSNVVIPVKDVAIKTQTDTEGTSVVINEKAIIDLSTYVTFDSIPTSFPANGGTSENSNNINVTDITNNNVEYPLVLLTPNDGSNSYYTLTNSKDKLTYNPYNKRITVSNIWSTSECVINGYNGVWLKYRNSNESGISLNQNYFKPFDASDSKLSLGISTARWKNIYASNLLNIINSTGDTTLGMTVEGKQYKIGFIIGTNNVQRGIYDYTNQSWICYKNNVSTYIPDWSTLGSSTQPVYFLDGKPQTCVSYNNLFTELSSNTTNIINVTVGEVTKSISADTLKSNLGLGNNAYTSTSYLPLTGGLLTGDLSIKTDSNSIIHLYPKNSNNYVLLAGHMSTSDVSNVTAGLQFNTSSASSQMNGVNSLTLFNNRGGNYYMGVFHNFNSDVKINNNIVYHSGNLSKTTLGLGNVENTALSTWTGSDNLSICSQGSIIGSKNIGQQSVNFANIAEKLNNSAGTVINPIYFADGKPVKCTYTLEAAVPSDAVFTDTKNTAGSINTEDKMYLVGATSQTTNTQTYSNSRVFTTSGFLSAQGMGKDGYIVYPKNGYYNSSNPKEKGYLRITLPQYSSDTMIKFDVNIFNCSNNTSVTYTISGHINNQSWYDVSAYSVGNCYGNLSNLPVFFGNNGSQQAIYIGTTETDWNCPKISISNITLGGSNITSQLYNQGWNVSFINSPLESHVEKVQNTHVGYDAHLLQGKRAQDFTEKLSWTGTIQKNEWSRLCHVKSINGGSSYILNIKNLTNDDMTKYDITYIINSYSSKQGHINISNSSVLNNSDTKDQIEVRIVVDDGGNNYFEIKHSFESQEEGELDVECKLIPISTSEIDAYIFVELGESDEWDEIEQNYKTAATQLHIGSGIPSLNNYYTSATNQETSDINAEIDSTYLSTEDIELYSKTFEILPAQSYTIQFSNLQPCFMVGLYGSNVGYPDYVQNEEELVHISAKIKIVVNDDPKAIVVVTSNKTSIGDLLNNFYITGKNETTNKENIRIKFVLEPIDFPIDTPFYFAGQQYQLKSTSGIMILFSSNSDFWGPQYMKASIKYFININIDKDGGVVRNNKYTRYNDGFVFSNKGDNSLTYCNKQQFFIKRKSQCLKFDDLGLHISTDNALTWKSIEDLFIDKV